MAPEAAGGHRAVDPKRQAAFLAQFPKYATTGAYDAMRAADFARVDAQGHTYLDTTGGTLYPISLLRNHLAMLEEGVLGNPHSSNPTSSLATKLVEDARHSVLSWLKADPRIYTCVFTSNASGALRLIAESFPFGHGGSFLLTSDNHNSVVGIREYARRAGAEVVTAPLQRPELRVDEAGLKRLLRDTPHSGESLFAYPAQSNFSGVQHPLSWVSRAQNEGWRVLLDTAAFLPTNSAALDLSVVQPDFMTISFYKIIGYPSGLGALVMKLSAAELLRRHRPWFAGGTVTVATVDVPQHVLAPYEAAFEEGTVAYTQIPAIKLGLDYIQRMDPETLHMRLMCLTGWMLKEMTSVKHSNGRELVVIHGPRDTVARGATVAFSLFDCEGKWIRPSRFERAGNGLKISCRVGCFCNPGAGESAFNLKHGTLERCYRRFGIPIPDDPAHPLNTASTASRPQSAGSSAGQGAGAGQGQGQLSGRAGPTSWAMQPVDDTSSTSGGCGPTSPISPSAASASPAPTASPALLRSNSIGSHTHTTIAAGPKALQPYIRDFTSSMEPLQKQSFFECLSQREEETVDADGVAEAPTGAIRVSLGLATNFQDVEVFLSFLRMWVDATAEEPFGHH